MSVRIMVGALLLASIGAGCIGTQVHFADVPMDKIDFTRWHVVTGRASGLNLFELIPIGINGRMARAYERLQEAAPDEYLTNIRVKDSWVWVWIGSKYGTTLSATAYPDKKTSPSAPQYSSLIPATQSLTQKLDELKGLREKGLLTEAEYDLARKKLLGI